VFQPAGFAALFQGMKKAQIDAFVEDRKTMRAGGAGRMACPKRRASCMAGSIASPITWPTAAPSW
jgi:hypothetical protein